MMVAFSELLRSLNRRNFLETSIDLDRDGALGHSSSARPASSRLKTTSPTDEHADRPGREVAELQPARMGAVVERRPVAQGGIGHRVELEQGLVVGRHDGERVDDRCQVEPDQEEDAHEVLDVPEVDVEGAQHADRIRARTAP